MRQLDLEGGGSDAAPFYLAPLIPPERLLANMRSSIARGLPEATLCKPHNGIMSIVGGGPSIADTYRGLEGWVCAVNGSLEWLMTRNDLPEGLSYACGICDAGEHIADMVPAHPDVRYYVASVADPRVFDKLKNCDVRLWHITPDSHEPSEEMTKILCTEYDEWIAIGGGCTMGLRWVNLGYFLGFRRYKMHGMDSSFRNGRTHAYPDRADDKEHMMFRDRLTRPNFIAQTYDFADMLEWAHELNPNIQLEVYGDGLLPDEWKLFREANPEAFRWRTDMYECEGYLFPRHCHYSEAIIGGCKALIPVILDHCKGRRFAVQAGGNVGVMPTLLAQCFKQVLTFEPDRFNFQCLALNTRDNERIKAFRVALGAETRVTGITAHAGNCGASTLDLTGNDTQVYPLDAYEIGDCDLICLDLEGYEFPALQGAMKTIERLRPVILVEDKHGADFGIPDGAIDELLCPLGYSCVWSTSTDKVFTCSSAV